MADAAVKEKPAAETERELTDGFNLIIDRHRYDSCFVGDISAHHQYNTKLSNRVCK